MIRFFRLASVLLILVAVSMLSAIATMHFAIHGAEVKVPDFKGMSLADARRQAAGLGLNLSADNRYYSAEIPAERILTQSPSPGTVVRREWHVRVSESLGPQKVSIPKVVGSPERAAELELRRLNLDLGSTAHMPYRTVAPGTVIAQDPQADAHDVEKPSVSLLIADVAPPEKGGFLMPDYVGKLAITAQASLIEAGFNVGPFKFVEMTIPSMNMGTNGQSAPTPVAPSAPPGTVIAQSPPPGHRVDASIPIILSVAK